MAEALLEIRNLCKSFGALRATDGVDLEVQEGETLAVIGPNGAGKTTLIGQLAGNLRPDAGRIRFAGEDVTGLSAPRRARKGFARSFQITSIFPEFTALENVALAIQAHQGHSFRFWRPAMKDPALLEPARRVLADVGLQDKVNAVAANMSHGEHRQLEVAMALATAPRLLLLDEPMAGLSAAESRTMHALIEQLDPSIAVLLIEHDMDVAFSFAERVTVLHQGRVLTAGHRDEVSANRMVQEIYLGTVSE